MNFGIIQQKTFNTKIISIGNISIGGTGKTPMIETISKELTKNNISHCIVSRGYKKRLKGRLLFLINKRLFLQLNNQEMSLLC